MKNLKIIDNFLKKEDFEYLSSVNLKKIGRNDVKVYHNSIDKEDKTNCECIDDEKIKNFQKNYHSIALNLLEELSPEKKKLYEFSEFHIIETGADYSFPIHDDIPNKLLSGVIYLKPEENTGTIFYDNKKGDGKQEIQWKPNRAVFFSRKERETWHSYKGDGKNNRIALVYNLMTNDVKSVYKIEKKSYFLGQIREKLNPYLHRYLNKII